MPRTAARMMASPSWAIVGRGAGPSGAQQPPWQLLQWSSASWHWPWSADAARPAHASREWWSCWSCWSGIAAMRGSCGSATVPTSAHAAWSGRRAISRMATKRRMTVWGNAVVEARTLKPRGVRRQGRWLSCSLGNSPEPGRGRAAVCRSLPQRPLAQRRGDEQGLAMRRDTLVTTGKVTAESSSRGSRAHSVNLVSMQ